VNVKILTAKDAKDAKDAKETQRNAFRVDNDSASLFGNLAGINDPGRE
jgi:hypothetical protein